MNDQQAKQAIVDALHGFAIDGSAQNAIKMFNSMGYDSEKRPAHVSNAPSDFIDDFDPSGKLNAGKGLLDRWQSIDLLFQLVYSFFFNGIQDIEAISHLFGRSDIIQCGLALVE